MERKKDVPTRKIQAVKEISELMKSKKTILLSSIINIPASQFQEISKKLRGKAIIKVPKKRLIFRAIDDIKDEDINKIKEHIKDNVAVLFSDLDSFELARELINNKTYGKAKAGQTAPEDIVLQKGPTDLPPGPAISELGVLGIPIQIEKGKISIKESKTIAKKGEAISKSAAEVMSKLDIKPIVIGFLPILAFDIKEKKLYLDINIDTEKTIEEMKNAFGKALPFAINIEYISKDTIKFLINKAGVQEKAMENIIGKEEPDKEDAGEKNSADADNKGNTEPTSEASANEPEPEKTEEKTEDNQQLNEIQQNKSKGE